jgi:hypothetical protein
MLRTGPGQRTDTPIGTAAAQSRSEGFRTDRRRRTSLRCTARCRRGDEPAERSVFTTCPGSPRATIPAGRRAGRARRRRIDVGTPPSSRELPGKAGLGPPRCCRGRTRRSARPRGTRALRPLPLPDVGREREHLPSGGRRRVERSGSTSDMTTTSSAANARTAKRAVRCTGVTATLSASPSYEQNKFQVIVHGSRASA